MYIYRIVGKTEETRTRDKNEAKYSTNVQQPNHSATTLKPLLHSCVCGTIYQRNARPHGAPPWVITMIAGQNTP